MPRINETVRTVNSSLRTLIGLAVVGMVGTAGWLGYSAYVEPGRRLNEAKAELDEVRRQLQERDEQIVAQSQQITQLTHDIEEKIREIARLETSLRLLKVDHRIAELRVIDQREDAATGRPMTTVEFVNINDEGAPIDEPKQYTVEGDIVYIEAKVVKFRDEFVEQSDPDRSTSLCLFQRLWGEYQQPIQGFPIDGVGSRPTAYARGGQLTEFEKSIWKDFWNYANDPVLAKSRGIEVANIEAPGMKVQPGKLYRIEIRASGGLSIKSGQQAGSGTPPSPDA
jgi:hypothetical protein